MKLYEILRDPIEYEHDREIKKLISKYANDPHMVVVSAVWLVRKIYNELGLEIPKLVTDENFDEYMEYAVLATTKLQNATSREIRDDSWKITPDSSPFASSISK